MSHDHVHVPSREEILAGTSRPIPRWLRTLSIILGVVGLIVFVAGAVTGVDRVWQALLVNWLYFTTISSAGVMFVAVQRITRHPSIDVSPSCGPGGQIAFVSNRHGSPQIFVMGGDGSGARRVTFRGAHNQTPAWCPDATKPLIAFTGRRP